MYRISKEFHFSSSHHLCDMPEGHPCATMHGHNYVVIVELESEKLDETGMVLDYHELAPIKRWLDETCDHQHLNSVLPFNPTAENMAMYFYGQFMRILGRDSHAFLKLKAVHVKETPKTIATYYE